MINTGRHLRILSSLWLWLGIVIAFAAPARALEENSLNQPVAPLRITEQDGEAGFEFHERDESEKNGDSHIKFSSRAFEEYVQYHARGYVYHPRFLDIDASVKLGLLQQSFSNSLLEDDNKSHPGHANSFLSAYHFYLSFFKEHPLSFTVHANRDHEAITELFTDQIMTETQDLGGSVHWKKGPFPMDLAVNQSRFKQWGFDSRSDAQMKTLDYSLRNSVGKWMQSELRYNYRDYKETFDTDSELFDLHRQTNLKSHDLNFNNSIYFDPSRRSSLSSTARWYRQSGSQYFETFNWQERLNLQHTRNLRTYYLLNYLQTKLREETITGERGEVGLDHKLFESLAEHLDLHWRQSQYGDVTEREYGPTGRLSYRKITPWGVLGMGYSATFDQVERTGTGSTQPIRHESLTLRNNYNNFLSQPAVIESSIEVYKSDGLERYVEGFDYEVRREGNRTALRILPGGRITDGQTVLVDYDVEFSSDISYTSNDQDFNISYDFERYLQGLSVYYRWHDLSALNAPQDDFSILQYKDNLAGFTYRWRWLTWREEYDVYRSNFSNYNQLLNQLEGLHEIGARLRLGWHVGASLTTYKDGELPQGQDYDNAYFAGASLRGAMRTNGYWEVGSEARRERGQVDETLFGLMGKLGIHWRKSRIEMGARVETRSRYDTDRNRSSVFLQFAREF